LGDLSNGKASGQQSRRAMSGDQARRGIRVLIDGPDLSGKTTLAKLLRSELEARGWKVAAAKGRIDPVSKPRILAKINPNNHPDSALLNTAYILDAIVDRVRRRDAPIGTIFITEGYVDRSIAYGLARRLGWVARLAAKARWLFPTFDVAILVTADLATRKARLSLRERPSPIDSRALESHYRFLAAYRLLFRRHRRRVAIDTSKVSVAASLQISLEQVLAAAEHPAIATGSRLALIVPGAAIALSQSVLERPGDALIEKNWQS